MFWVLMGGIVLVGAAGLAAILQLAGEAEYRAGYLAGFRKGNSKD